MRGRLRVRPRPRLAIAGVAVVVLAALGLGTWPNTYAYPSEGDPGSYPAQMSTPALVVPVPSGPARPGAQPPARAGVRGEGAVLVVTDPTNPYTDDVCDALLSTAGFACAATDAGALTTAVPLTSYRVIVVADQVALTRAQVARLTGWVRGGGDLIALRPLVNLDGLLGLRPRTAVLGSGYLRAESGQIVQVHAPSDVHRVHGAQVVARVSGGATSPTVGVGITRRTYGEGSAQAWSFDPAEAVLLDRDGDPRLTGQPTVSSDGQVRLQDRMGRGFLDPALVSVPQADLLLNRLTAQISAAGVPRLWYLPNATDGTFRQAAVVLTGDDHAINSHTVSRFAKLASLDPPGCSLSDWSCSTATAYTFPGAVSPSQAQTWTARGFEIAPHIATTGLQCAGNDDALAQAQAFLALWSRQYPGLPAPQTTRWHCYGLWSSYAGIPDADHAVGLSADTSTACWPQAAFGTAPCYVAGSALPMPYADDDGRLTGVQQFPTLITDENPATSSPAAVKALLSSVTGYATVLAHLDGQPVSHALMADLAPMARALGIPMVSTARAEQFWAARAATVTTLGPGGRLTVSDAPTHLTLLVPMTANGRHLRGITFAGGAVAVHTRMLGGISYAVVPDAGGSYRLTYR